MLIRAEQMTVFAATTENNFVRRLSAHLRDNYAAATVRLPDSESSLGDLPEEKLHSLVEISVERARQHGLTYESSISAFSALMFEVAPNFDQHRLSQVMLTDENIEPDGRLDELLEVLTEKNWETIRAEYDVNAWQSPAVTEKGTAAEPSGEIEKMELTGAAALVESAEKPKPPVAIDDINFGGTIASSDGAKKTLKAGSDDDLDLSKTVPNFVVSKE